MRLLDCYSGAGGAARGYQMAGFEVVGIDYLPQKHYVGEAFVQMNAIAALDVLLCGGAITDAAGREWRLSDFDAIHASPPCQAHTSLKAMWNARQHAQLIAPTRELLEMTGLPYVIENVPGAPFRYGVVLCGTMFRLGCEGAELRRHRIFETTFPILSPFTCAHGWSGRDTEVAGVSVHAGGFSHRQRYAVIGVYGGHGRDRRRIKNGQHFSTALRAEAMGISWMTGTELSQSIPPAYTEWLGSRLIETLAQGG